MKRYSRQKRDFCDPKFPWVKFKIIAKTEKDKQELLKAFKYLHDADIDTDFIAVNQLVHLYSDHPADPCKIEVENKIEG